MPQSLIRKLNGLSRRCGPIQGRVRSPQYPGSKPSPGRCRISPWRRDSHKINARYVDRLKTPTAGPARVSNNPCHKSPSAWLLCHRFFDTPHAAGLLWTSEIPCETTRKEKPWSTGGDVDRQPWICLHSDRHALETRLSTAALRLGRHEDDHTWGCLADLLGRPTEHNVQ
jgi:hypothetical protein